MASFTKGSSKAGSGTGGGAFAQAKHHTGGGGGILEKIANIEHEMAKTQKNKATSSHLGLLKAKLCQLKRDLLEPGAGSGGGKCPGFEVQKMGDARVGLVGFPSVGKSSLLTALTGQESEVAAYEFTTLTCIPGVIYYNDVKIQLLDLPGIVVGASEGRGRGRQVIATAKSCDIILMCLDASKDEVQTQLLTRELENIGIRINTRPADISFYQTKGGGVKFNAVVPQTTGFDWETCNKVLKQYKIHNADVIVREDCTVDQFIDIIDGNRKYCKCLYVYNKVDMLNPSEVDALARRPNSVVVSVRNPTGSPWNLDTLLARMWSEMDVIRVYTKKKGAFPDFRDPIVITSSRGLKNFTVENAVYLVHKSLLDDFKHVLVWGSSVKTSPGICGKSHILHDEDVIQIVKKTHAEKVKATTGKKTGQTVAGSNTKVDEKKK